MQTYYIDTNNIYTIRTVQTTANALTMSLQDMLLLQNQTASLSGVTYDSYESLLAFTASIANPKEGSQYRAEILNGDTVVWNGTLQVFGAPSASKAEYETQIDQYKSYESTNEYILL